MKCMLRTILECLQDGTFQSTEDVVNYFTKKVPSKEFGWALTTNEGVAHRQDYVEFVEGDLVKFDSWYRDEDTGMWLDAAITAEYLTNNHQDIVDTTRRSLRAGYLAAVAGNTIGDISNAIAASVEGFSIIRELSGHGIGKELHMEPTVSNWPNPRTDGVGLYAGMRLAIEPLIMYRGAKFDKDSWTVTEGVATHWEVTIEVTSGQPKLLYGVL